MNVMVKHTQKDVHRFSSATSAYSISPVVDEPCVARKVSSSEMNGCSAVFVSMKSSSLRGSEFEITEVF
jgi:hypothetical protein